MPALADLTIGSFDRYSPCNDVQALVRDRQSTNLRKVAVLYRALPEDHHKEWAKMKGSVLGVDVDYTLDTLRWNVSGLT